MKVTAELTAAVRRLDEEWRAGARPAGGEAIRVLVAAGLTSAVLGRDEALVRTIVELGQEHGGVGRAPVPGATELLDPVVVATATGTAGSLGGLTAWDPGSDVTVLIPLTATVWSVGVARDLPVAQCLGAFTAGLEAQRRVAAAMQPEHAATGWDASATTAVLGCAYAAGLLVGIGPDDLAQVVGVAASQSVGMGGALGTPLGHLHAGKAAANAVLSAYLVEQRFTGSRRVLEAPRGWFAVFLDDPERAARVLEAASPVEELLLGTTARGRDDTPCTVDALLGLAEAVGGERAARTARSVLDVLDRPRTTASDLLDATRTEVAA